MPYERDNIRRLEPYVPGEQPQLSTLIKLNTNENPYTPAAQVLDAIKGVMGDSLRRYPPPDAAPFRQVAARIHGLNPDQVIVTNGGDELLRLAITVFCRTTTASQTTGGVGVERPTYSLFNVLAQIHDTPLTHVALHDDWSLPDDFAGRLLNAGCRLGILVNPHAPSGVLRSLDQLLRIARQLQGKAVLLIDEAYVDFAEHDALSLVRSGIGLDNVLLLRSLSKGYSLAGLRFGYGLGHEDLIRALDKARDSYNTDVVSQAAAVSALECRDHAACTWQKVVAQRGRMTDEFTARGFEVIPSQANFLLAQVPADRQAGLIHESLKRKGVYVRYFDEDRLRDKLRITIGTPQQNDALLAALDQL